MLHQSYAARGTIPVPYPSNAGQVVAARYSFDVPANVALNDIVELAPIPAGCRVVDMIADCDDLDSNGAAAVVIDVGIMNGAWGANDAGRTCGNEFFSASNLAQAGGTARPTDKGAFRTGSADYDRSIGVKFTTAPATGQAGTIALTVFLAAG